MEHAKLRRHRSIVVTAFMDFSQVICVNESPVAVLLAGQFARQGQKEKIRSVVQRIADGERREVAFLDAGIAGELQNRSPGLTPPPLILQHSSRGRWSTFQAMATVHHLRQKAEYENAFLDKLRQARRFTEVTTLQEIGDDAERLLRIVQEQCRTQYIVMFCNIGENDTVLAPIAQVGLRGAGKD